MKPSAFGVSRDVRFVHFNSEARQSRQSCGEVLGVATPRFWVGGGRGVVEDRGRIVKYYYILLCTGILCESADF